MLDLLVLLHALSYHVWASQAKLLSFLKANVVSVASVWDSVKTAVKDHNAEVKAKKERIKAMEAAEQAKLDNLPIVDVSGDGGVMVQV